MIINKMLENMRTHRLKFGSLYPPTIEEWEAINAHLAPVEQGKQVLYDGIWVRLDDQSPAQRSKILCSPRTIWEPVRID
jgi:hypothetical protein